MQILIKLVAGNDKRIIGWKGEVLEVMLPSPSPESLQQFFSENLGLSLEEILVKGGENKIYLLEIGTKYAEDPVILLT